MFTQCDKVMSISKILKCGQTAAEYFRSPCMCPMHCIFSLLLHELQLASSDKASSEDQDTEEEVSPKKQSSDKEQSSDAEAEEEGEGEEGQKDSGYEFSLTETTILEVVMDSMRTCGLALALQALSTLLLGMESWVLRLPALVCHLLARSNCGMVTTVLVAGLYSLSAWQRKCLGSESMLA